MGSVLRKEKKGIDSVAVMADVSYQHCAPFFFATAIVGDVEFELRDQSHQTVCDPDISAEKSSERAHESSPEVHQGPADCDQEVLTGATQYQSRTQTCASEDLPLRCRLDKPSPDFCPACRQKGRTSDVGCLGWRRKKKLYRRRVIRATFQ